MFIVAVDINECESQPCQNGGRCDDDDNRFTCTCQDGYTGDNCESKQNTLLTTTLTTEQSI